MAGAALGAAPARFAWQVQYLEHLRRVLRGRRSTCSTCTEVGGSPATSEYYERRLLLQVQHLEQLSVNFGVVMF